MRAHSLPSRRKQESAFTRFSFWIIAAMLGAIALLHYATPQMRSLSPRLDTFLSRHSVERIMFILPMAAATYAFGQVGGLVVLALSVVLMLPRVFWISPYPVDALFEVAATGVVGYLVIWMIETQEREKRLREKAVEELRAVNNIATTVSQSLDLNEILAETLRRITEITELEPRGGIFLIDGDGSELTLGVQQGLTSERMQEAARLAALEHMPALLQDPDGVYFSGAPVEEIQDAQQHLLEPYAVAPLFARGQVLGCMVLGLSTGYIPTEQDDELLTSIGNQVGLAIENARLYENLRFYVREIGRTQENERKRIAQELHDETIQMLIATSRRLEAVTDPEGNLSESALQSLDQARALTRSAIGGVRRFVQDLRPPTLDHLGLIAALEGLVSDLREVAGIDTELTVDGDVRRLSSEEELMLFRIAQEGLSNIKRHSGASRAALHIEFFPTRLRLVIGDNGHGFNVPDRIGGLVAKGKLGLVGMEERAHVLGGKLAIQSVPEGGTRVIADVPLQPRWRNGQEGI